MTEQENTKDVVIERSFDAPIDLVWRMWTEPEHFKAWYGPTGALIPTAEIDPSVGGRRFISMEMQTPNGTMQMWFVGEHLEVDAPNRLVYTESMCDADGNVTPAADMGMPDDHPTETRVVVELADDGGKTKLTLTHVGVPADSPGASGWTMALDKLTEHVDAMKG